MLTNKRYFSPSQVQFRAARVLTAIGLATAPLSFGAGCAGSDASAPPTIGEASLGGAGGASAGAPSGSSGAAVAGASSAGAPAGGAGAAGSSAAGAFSVGGAPAAGAAGAGGSASAGASGVAGAAGQSSSTPGCTGKAYKLCEDFESGSSGALPTGWTKFKGYGAGSAQDAVLATDQFHSGKMALKSNSMATGQGRIQKSLSALGATAAKHWGRVFYKVQSPATKPNSGVLHVTFLGLSGSGENRVVDIVEDSKGKHQWLYNNPDDKGSLGSSYDWTFDAEWHCAEWRVDVAAKSYQFFSDSQEVKSIGFTGKNDAEMSNYTTVIVGSTFYQSPPAPFVMWFDDLAIDDNQIGCQ
jgi:hypothetical protein